ncbi:MAG: transglutaminase-like domain-containing protein [Propionibacteriaceae bacterium]|jgi:hypothetical protein|nr:transglutaminase-like domain-containing protein [Propionibacteriaceae bacterium]
MTVATAEKSGAMRQVLGDEVFRQRLVDTLFVATFTMVALVGFATTFDSWWFLIVAAIGTALGVFAARLTVALRWHWTLAIALIVLLYFGFGGVVALRDDLIWSVAPSVTTLQNLAGAVITGWKDLLTIGLPVAGDSGYLVLVFLLALVFSGIGLLIALRGKATYPPLLAPSLLLAVVILLADFDPAYPNVIGIVFMMLMVTWLALRKARQGRIAITGAARLSRVVGGFALVMGVVAGALFFGGRIPGIASDTRLVLRSYVHPPIELLELPGPLGGFRKYSSELVDDSLYDKVLLTVTGAPAGAVLRIAVLDNYDGTVWAADSGTTTGTFRRFGSRIPVFMAGVEYQATITLSDDYTVRDDLASWLPSFGPAITVTFDSDRARENLVYDLNKSQGVVADRMRAGERYTITGVVMPQLADEIPTPSGMPVVPSSRSEFMAEPVSEYTRGASSPWQALKRFGEELTNGYWSDGTREGEAAFLPGHGQSRMVSFFFRWGALIGSDEHYATAFALAANRLGFPARVIFGAEVPDDGVVRGRDVHAWVEISTTAGWRLIPYDVFIPGRDAVPKDWERDESEDRDSTFVPPPKPNELSNAQGDTLNTEATASKGEQGSEGLLGLLPVWARQVVGIGGSVKLLAGAVVLYKLLRATRRRVHGTYPQRVAGGWAEVLDRARDLGYQYPQGATYRAQATNFGFEPLSRFADMTDRVMFGATAPDQADVVDYWAEVRSVRAELGADASGWRRFWARLSPRSLLSPLTGNRSTFGGSK